MRLDDIKKALEDVYNKYREQGIEAIYLWGSVITKDFIPESSDVDSIAIVKDSTDLKLEDEIKKYLFDIYPDIHKFGLRFLYVSELNGRPSKGFLTSVIDPQVLLLDLPNWKHVAGKKYVQDDFDLPVPTFPNAINLQLDKIHKFHWENVSETPEGLHTNFLKCIARVIDYQQQDRGIPTEPFSYNKILESSNNEEKAYAKAILDIKNNNWSYSLFTSKTPLFQEFVDNLRGKQGLTESSQ